MKLLGWFVVCVCDRAYAVSLGRGEIYEVVAGGVLRRRLIRVVDESGEDYLYSQARFVPVGLLAAGRAVHGG